MHNSSELNCFSEYDHLTTFPTRFLNLSEIFYRSFYWLFPLLSSVVHTGWYPELVFLAEVSSNSTVSAEVIPINSVFETFYNYFEVSLLEYLLNYLICG